MTHKVTRRNFIGMTAALSSSMALAVPLRDYIKTPEGKDKVFEILQRNFDLTEADRHVAESLHQSLSRSLERRQSPEEFNRKLEKSELDEQLEIYIIEEFVVSTNYFALQQGEEDHLRFVSLIS